MASDIDITVHEGARRKPALLFIHGLGMDKSIWEDPAESRMLGGSLPVSLLVSKKPLTSECRPGRTKTSTLFPLTTGIKPKRLVTTFHDMREKGYTVVTWSQKRPVGPIDAAVGELHAVIECIQTLAGRGIIIIGHSRGGLVARKYLLRKDRRVKGLITVCTPHRGSSLAQIALYMSPLSSILSPMVTYRNTGKLNKVLRRMLDFLESRAVRELLPGSSLFADLSRVRMQGISLLTVGGTNPSLFRLYRWKRKTLMRGSVKKCMLLPEEIFSIPGIFEKIIPANLFPVELKKGEGDGIVSAESSKIEQCGNHYDFPLNHAQILFDKKVRNVITAAIDGIV